MNNSSTIFSQTLALKIRELLFSGKLFFVPIIKSNSLGIQNVQSILKQGLIQNLSPNLML
jgi:hypothetical protein